MGGYYAKCEWCGTSFEKSGINKFLAHNTMGIAGSQKYCSKRCENEAEAASGSDSSSGKSGSGSSFMKDFVSSSDSSSGKSAERIRAKAEANAQAAKRVDESDAKFNDSIKKLVLFPLNKKAKELHSKLEEMETDISIAISKGNVDEAAGLIRQLKHGSSFFVPKTNTTYSQYWAEKREYYLAKF